jgi:hypothetical protein
MTGRTHLIWSINYFRTKETGRFKLTASRAPGEFMPVPGSGDAAGPARALRAAAAVADPDSFAALVDAI